MEYIVEKLQAMTDDLRERMIGLQGFDAISEIHAYCDNLGVDVTVAFESAFRHLQRLQESMLGEIGEYRSALIEAQQQRTAFSDGKHRFTYTKEIEELAAFREMIPLMNEQSRWCVSIGLKNQLKVVREQEAELRKETMDGRFMLFKPNRFFDIVIDHVGSFEYLEEIPPACGKLDIQDKGYRVDKSCRCILQISFMPCDRLVLSTLERGVFIYRASDLSLLERLTDLAMSFSVLPNERLLVAGRNGQMRIYDLSTPPGDDGKRDFVVLDSNQNRTRTIVCSQVFLPNGNLATSDLHGHIEIWDFSLVGTNRALLLSLDEKTACALGALSNGFLVSCTMWNRTSNVLKLWDLKRPTKPLRVAETQLIAVMHLLVLPNDNVALGDMQGNIAIYDLIAMLPVRTFRLETCKGYGALAFLPNGCLMSADAKNLFHLWDLNTGNLVQTLETGTSKEVAAIHISPDGKRMAISAYSEELRTFKLEIAP